LSTSDVALRNLGEVQEGDSIIIDDFDLFGVSVAVLHKTSLGDIGETNNEGTSR
jgi:hypothetical protein